MISNKVNLGKNTFPSWFCQDIMDLHRRYTLKEISNGKKSPGNNTEQSFD